MTTRTLSEKEQERQIEHVFPRWYSILYGAFCGILIPWTVFLAFALPHRYVSHHWDVAWVGFDIFECLLFIATAILALQHSIWTAVTSAMLGTLLLVDAWFDILTARAGRDERSAVIEALVVELPLAIVSFVIAQRVFNYVRKHAGY